MDSTTVQAAARTTGWSARMLRYLDAAGLVRPPRNSVGYRLYGGPEIAALRELRQLLADHDLKPADLQVALRLRSEPGLRQAVDGWLEAASVAADPNPDPDPTSVPAEDAPSVPADETASVPADRADQSTPATSWLRFEQDKHSRHLHSRATPMKENA